MTTLVNDKLQQLAQQKCVQCRQGDPALPIAKTRELMTALPHWELVQKHSIRRTWNFANFAETMQFVETIAVIATTNDHHPDVSFGYNYCTVLYSTHAINELSENDFICAAQIELISTEK